MKQTLENNRKQIKGLCSQIAHSDEWPTLKAVLFSNIIDPSGFPEVKRAIDLIESMTDEEAPASPGIVNDKTQANQKSESPVSGIDPDLAEA